MSSGLVFTKKEARNRLYPEWSKFVYCVPHPQNAPIAGSIQKIIILDEAQETKTYINNKDLSKLKDGEEKE